MRCQTDHLLLLLLLLEQFQLHTLCRLASSHLMVVVHFVGGGPNETSFPLTRLKPFRGIVRPVWWPLSCCSRHRDRLACLGRFKQKARLYGTGDEHESSASR